MLTSMTIKARLLMLGSAAILGIFITAGLSLQRLGAIEDQLETTLESTSKGIELMINVSAANVHFKTQIQEWKNLLIRANSKEALEQYTKAFKKEQVDARQELEDSLRLMQSLKHPRQKEVETVIKQLDELNTLYLAQIAAWDVTDPNNMRRADTALRGRDRAATDGMNALVEGMEKDEKSRMTAQITNAQAFYTQTRNVFIGIVSGLFVFVAFLLLTTIRTINHKIANLQDAVTGIRQSLDLSRRLPAEGGDEIALASRSVNDLLGEFQTVLSRMKESAAQVSDASSGLSGSVNLLSESVSQQNESTGAMAASVEQLAVSVTHISDSSSTAQKISHESERHAQSGGEVIRKTVDGMVAMKEALETTSATVSELGRRSQAIGHIAGVIKEIADQTNLLALNAAIEAARAGEQGRGFAVVADEVRKLAERTTGATSEIAGVIGAIQSDTERAVHDMALVVDQASSNAEIARAAGNAIIDIQNGSSDVLKVTTDIASALSEQSSANDLIAQQVEVIATMSEKNSSALSTVRNASEEMKALAAGMHATVARFQV